MEFRWSGGGRHNVTSLIFSREQTRNCAQLLLGLLRFCWIFSKLGCAKPVNYQKYSLLHVYLLKLNKTILYFLIPCGRVALSSRCSVSNFCQCWSRHLQLCSLQKQNFAQLKLNQSWGVSNFQTEHPTNQPTTAIPNTSNSLDHNNKVTSTRRTFAGRLSRWSP